MHCSVYSGHIKENQADAGCTGYTCNMGASEMEKTAEELEREKKERIGRRRMRRWRKTRVLCILYK